MYICCVGVVYILLHVQSFSHTYISNSEIFFGDMAALNDYTNVCQQNLMRHLKLVEDESQQMVYDDQRLPLSQFREELER